MTGIDQTTFAEEVGQAGDNLSPVRAGLLLARECAYPELVPSRCLAQLDELAERAEPLLQSFSSAEARTDALAEFLFQSEGFRGNTDDYSDPRNSYLNQVLERRLGLPISLSIIFVELARRAGLPASGIGLPGHFIAGVMLDEGPVYLDPFHAGRRLTEADCTELVSGVLGRPASFDPRWLRPTPPRDIVARMLNNLRGFYISVDDWPMAIRIVERLIVLQPAVSEHVRDLGILYYRRGALGRAAELLGEYVRRSPAAPDADAVRKGRDHLRDELARLN
jgi:regulator of sirC expression with transglutaminase-like and TPR domain